MAGSPIGQIDGTSVRLFRRKLIMPLQPDWAPYQTFVREGPSLIIGAGDPSITGEAALAGSLMLSATGVVYIKVISDNDFAWKPVDTRLGGSQIGSEEITLSAQNILDGFVLLAQVPPEPTQVQVSIVSGCAQKQLADFAIFGQNLVWTGLGMATILDAGDTLVVFY